MPPVPARDIYVTANGLRHHLIARGSPGSPIVVMIHGLTQQAHVFDQVAEALSVDFHVYCLDVRGRGESEWGPPDGYTTADYVADLEAVRDALGLQRFSIVGTSMGGLIAMNYVPEHPDRVRKVVLNDIGPEIDQGGLKRIMEMLITAPEAFSDLKTVARYYREQNPAVLGNRTDDEVMEYARWHVRYSDSGLYVWKMDPAVRKPQQPPPNQPDPWDLFRRMPCPVLVVRGAESDVLSAETAKRMTEEGKECRVVEVPGIGHAPSLTEPEAWEALHTFLRED